VHDHATKKLLWWCNGIVRVASFIVPGDNERNGFKSGALKSGIGSLFWSDPPA